MAKRPRGREVPIERVELPSFIDEEETEHHWIDLRTRVTNADRRAYLRGIEALPVEESKVALVERDDKDKPIIRKDGTPKLQHADDGSLIYEVRLLPRSSDTLGTMTDAMELLIVGWSFDEPIPSEAPGTLDGFLAIDEYEELASKAAPIVRRILPNFATPDPDSEDAADRGSPTGPSSASGTR